MFSHGDHANVIVIGAGAAGLMCAVVAAERGLRVMVLDHQLRVGRKVLISGGGRCNFTNTGTEPEHYLCRNPHFPKSALARYTPYDFLTLMSAHNLTWNEKAADQLFCDQGAEAVLGMLLTECVDKGVDIHPEVAITRVAAENGGFQLRTDRGPLRCDKLVVATGGISLPKLGATDYGYRLAEQFGLGLVPTRAGLVPFTLSPKDLETWGGLAGVSTRVRVTTDHHGFTDDLLFTHRGLSGPAILQLSSYWRPGQPIVINLFPDDDPIELLARARMERPKAAMHNVLAQALPKRLAATLCHALLPDKPLGMLSDRELTHIGDTLSAWHITPAGTEGYRIAEVTLGGVDTDELSSKTMEARKVPGLYFIGEVVDVTGHLGGYNFQWAWASANAAGNAV